MNKNVYDYLAEMEQGIHTIMDTSNLMRAKTESYQKEMQSYQDKIEKIKQRLQVINERQVIVELSDVYLATAKEWGVSPEDLVVNYATKWDQVSEMTGMNDYEATKRANKFNTEKGKSTEPMLFNFDIEYQKNGAVVKQRKIPVTMPLTFLQKDGKPLASHVSAKVYSRNRILQKLVIDDINQILLTYQLRELIKAEDNQFIPCNDLAMTILDCSVQYDERKAKENRNMDF